jgi:hypothetical protein
MYTTSSYSSSARSPSRCCSSARWPAHLAERHTEVGSGAAIHHWDALEGRPAQTSTRLGRFYSGVSDKKRNMYVTTVNKRELVPPFSSSYLCAEI